MDYVADEFKNVAMVNKKELMKKTVIIPINSHEYKFKISGLGQKAIKLEHFFYYGKIIDNVQDGITDGLEYLIEQIIIDPKKEKVPTLDSSTELKLRATANKQALKRMSVEAFVGTKLYQFRIAGIGGRSVKLEVYVGYEDIANELNNGNNINLEFILKEVLIGNEIDYSIFDDVEIEDIVDDPIVDEEEYLVEESNDEDIVITKLTPNESDEIISKIEGIPKLIFDSINGIDSDIFTIDDVLEQDLIKSYEVQGKSFKPLITKNIDDFIDLGIIARDNDNKYHKLW